MRHVQPWTTATDNFTSETITTQKDSVVLENKQIIDIQKYKRKIYPFHFCVNAIVSQCQMVTERVNFERWQD